MLSLQVSNRINSGRIDLYFASELNPVHNPASSNPLEIFAKLDRVSRGGLRQEDWEKAETIKAALANWAYEAHEKGLILRCQSARLSQRVALAQLPVRRRQRLDRPSREYVDELASPLRDDALNRLAAVDLKPFLPL